MRDPAESREAAIYEQLFDRLPKHIQDEIEKNTTRGSILDENFQKYISQIFTEDDVLQEMQILDAIPTSHLLEDQS